ncbi:PE-PPE domain-containing protein [Streptomyces sp. B-S-A8]|uniref:PE-PPE domain-containing protein n=1 Tax=Streptomyces solicavernae TaxID=3043614 RepID=A0ABT6S1S9_9ACTN|nr:cutinase family protein [Streptomyces sp. B-S-A8]MDI3389948.1 PE-PPE domain-containing protein [Streptomyces sp. B-S-A8]
MRRVLGAAAATVAMAVGSVVALPGAAQAAEEDRYYIQIGGTGATPGAPHCTYSYDAANAKHQLGDRAIPVCYPASAGPFIGPGGPLVDDKGVHPEALTAPTYDASVRKGIEEGLRVAEETHQKHPEAQLTIAGYSQGAHAADEILQKIARGETSIPRELVTGKLYADPMQPGTGLGAQAPRGFGIPGFFTAPGAGPTDFNGIPVTRYCINGDPICDASLLNAPGYYFKHGNYPKPGNVIEQTLTQESAPGIQWRDDQGNPAPRP